MALTQGDSYLFEPEHQYAVFAYDLDRFVDSYTSLLHPIEERRLSRFYPTLIGAAGRPGDGLLIAQRSREGLVTFVFGYVGWDGFPILVKTLRCTSLWDGKEPMGLDQNNVNWLRQQIDRRTLVKAKVLNRNRLNYSEAERNRIEVLAQSARLLEQYKQQERVRQANTPAAKRRRERARLRRLEKARVRPAPCGDDR